MKGPIASHSPLTNALDSCRDPAATEFASAWVGLEPTFQTAKSVRKWKKLSATEGGEDAYFEDPYMLKMERKAGKTMKKHYRQQQRAGDAHCLFETVELEEDRDPWLTRRQTLRFRGKDKSIEALAIHLTLDAETFEYGIKPVPLAWFYEDRFVAFLDAMVWQVPASLGMSAAMGHGGGQFHLSAKTFLGGSLLADIIGHRLNHPELASWIMDYPQVDDRGFRATRQRKTAFEEILQHYWDGRFHPNAIGVLNAENAYLDRGFGPAPHAARALMNARGPTGSSRDVFQTNFAFGRAVRWQAQNIHPGYWQSAHPRDDDGYRPDQIMRYSEGNLNRLQIAGELHVKNDEVLDIEQVPDLDALLDLEMLATEASWEVRAHMSRTSARDFAEAVLLEMHYAQYLQANPRVTVRTSLLQDQILSEADTTLKTHGAEATLSRVKREAVKLNLDASSGRIKSDWVEPEALFWAAWHALPAGEKAAIAEEAVSGFLALVENAAKFDPRKGTDPMEWHRHRIHPLIWDAFEAAPDGMSKGVRREWKTWQAKKDVYLGRRPIWSQDKKNTPPWEETP